MMGIKSSISSILIIVAFLALVAIAAVAYKGEATENADASQTELYQKVGSALSALWTASESFAGINFIKSTNLAAGSPEAAALASPGRWAQLWSKVKEEWQTGGETGIDLEKMDFSLPTEEAVKEKINSLSDF